ncbi:MAG: SGNH/GDSL hydrolase family protein [Bacillota bacterium]
MALGDSLTVGVGSCPGYPARVAAGLGRRLGRPVRCANRGRIRMTSVDLARALRGDPGLQSAVAGADLITLCIGGNDLLRCGRDEICLERSVRAFPRRWEAVCQEVRRLNDRAPLVALTLYCPYPPGHPRGEQGLRLVEKMNQAIRDPALLAAFGMHLVDIAPVLHGRQRELTWIDLGDLHPTGFGQQRIAHAVLEGCLKALAGSGAAPEPARAREAMGGVAGGPEARLPGP